MITREDLKRAGRLAEIDDDPDTDPEEITERPESDDWTDPTESSC